MIKVSNISKIFRLYRKPSDRLREILFRRCCHREFYALQDVSFEVADGETLGIIGENGAGKSTLLKILAGVSIQESGTVEIEGEITGLLELGTGFNHEFTGLRNIYMNGTFLNMERAEIDSKLERIIAFSELGEFIEEPVKTYSSGMVMRLAFSIAIHADPGAFLVDEALRVGDAYFQQKCMRRLKKFKKNGGSIVFVSHDANAVKVLCDRAILLQNGKVIECGSPETVLNTYNFLIARKKTGIAPVIKKESNAYGNHRVMIQQVEMKDVSGKDSDLFTSGAPVTVAILLKARDDVDDLTIGIAFRDRFGQDIFGINSFHMHRTLTLEKGKTLEVSYIFDEFNIGAGQYTLSIAAHSGDTHIDNCYHWIDRAKVFEIVPGNDLFFTGMLRMTPRLETHPTRKADRIPHSWQVITATPRSMN